MAETDLAEILAACLDDIKAGRRSLEECLAANPSARTELEPLLSLTQRIAPAPRAEIDPARKLQARVQFTEALHRQRRLPWWRRPWPALRPAYGWRMMPVLAALTLAIVFGTGGTAVFAAAQEAQPDDPLYGLKTAIEQVQVAVALSDDARAEAQLQIAERRLAELTRALETGNQAAATQTAHAYQVALEQAEKHLAKAEQSGKDVGKLQDRANTDQRKGQEILRSSGSPAVGPAGGSSGQPGSGAAGQQGGQPAQEPAGEPRQKPQDQGPANPPVKSQGGRPDQPPGKSQDGRPNQAPGKSQDGQTNQPPVKAQDGQPDQPSGQTRHKDDQSRGSGR